MKEIIEKIKGSKACKTYIVVIISIISVIFWNIFCCTTEFYDLQIKKTNIERIMSLEVLFAFIYTYLGYITSLFFMENKSNYKEILVISIPLSIISMIICSSSNMVVANIFIIFIYFFYRYFKNRKSLISTFLYLIGISLIQYLFYYFKYIMLQINYDIFNETLKLFLGLDYYILMLFIILLVNKLRK